MTTNQANRPRTCSTCAHRQGFTFEFGRCALSGYYLTTERKIPTRCGKNFEGWQPRESLWRRFLEWLIGAPKEAA